METNLLAIFMVEPVTVTIIVCGVCLVVIAVCLVSIAIDIKKSRG